MTTSNSNRLRLTGKLIKGERRYILQCDDESVWRLDFRDLDIPNEGSEVTLEGTQSGTDTIDVDWVGSKRTG